MRPRPALAALAVPALLLLGCSASGDGSAGDDPTATTERPSSTTTPTEDPAEALAATVDATLAAESFSIDATADLEVAFQQLGYRAQGRVAYLDVPITDLTLEVVQGGASTTIQQRSDGTKLWIAADGPNAPEFPDGKTWIEGDAAALAEADGLEPIGLVGVVVALRAAEDIEVEAGEEIDGVATTKYTATVSYEEAVAEAGAEEEGFKASLSLTSPDDPILDVEVWVGDDGIVRRFQLEIEPGEVEQAPSGSYDLELSDVDQDVDPPDAPNPDDTLTGPRADALFQQFLAS